MDKEIVEFVENGIEFKGILRWSASSAGAGFSVEMVKPYVCKTKFCKYYTTSDGKAYKEPVEELARKLMLEAWSGKA